MEQKFFVYILYSQKRDRYYVGSTEDIDQRLSQHNNGRSKYTKTGIPWTLKYVEEYSTRKKAMSREYDIKAKKRRSYIEALIEGESIPQ